MSIFLSHIHDTIRQARLTRRGATHRPEDVPRGVHKAYQRMKRIPLPTATSLDTVLEKAITLRRSYRDGTETSTISLAQYGTLLGTALGNSKEIPSLRHYPSGGALYPIETYILTTLPGNTSPTAYHYNPTEHSLEILWPMPYENSIKDIAPKPDDLLFTSLLVFTSVWQRSSAKYGDLAYSHALLEAGHMSQNILLVATALGLHTRPLAGFSDELITKILDLDPEEEQPVHAVAIC